MMSRLHLRASFVSSSTTTSFLRRLSSPMTALLLSSSMLLSVASCDGAAEADAGDDDDDDVDDDAGVVVDAGSPYTGPAYEVEDGWFDDDSTLPDAPFACGKSPYRWWGVSELGDVQSQELKGSFAKTLLQSFKGQLASSIKMSRDPQHDVALYRMRYTTQDKGSLTEATGLVAYPVASSSTEFPVVLYLHGTVGFTDKCSPSSGIDSLFQPNYVSAATLAMFASWGYVVVAPDYLGLRSVGEASPELHPYLIAEPTAIASIDGVRAARKLMSTLGTAAVPSDDVVVVGVSQGGHAAGFTVRYQPHYAPEMNIKGAVYIVPPLDLVGESEKARESTNPTTKGNTAAFLATALSWYESDVPLNDAMKVPHDADVLDQVNNVCGAPSLSGNAADVFSPTLIDGTLEPFACYARESGLLTTSVPRTDDVPGLMILAEDDALVSREVEREAFLTMCDDGVRLEFLECENATHIQGYTFSVDDAFSWMDARLADLPLATPCTLAPSTKCSSDPR